MNTALQVSAYLMNKDAKYIKAHIYWIIQPYLSWRLTAQSRVKEMRWPVPWQMCTVLQSSHWSILCLFYYFQASNGNIPTGLNKAANRQHSRVQVNCSQHQDFTWIFYTAIKWYLWHILFKLILSRQLCFQLGKASYCIFKVCSI